MHDTTIAAKLLKQLESFSGRISPHFHKPAARFIGDMVYGIMAEKDVKLSSVVRALKEETTPKKVEDRLSRMLSSDGLEAGLHGFVASEGAGKVPRDTLIIPDPSDVQKPYAKKTEHLARVWDGSKGEVGDNLGFWGCMAVACESGGRRPIPLHFRLWSADSPGFVSENEDVKSIVDGIIRHTKRRGDIRVRPWRRQHRVLPPFPRKRAGFHRPTQGKVQTNCAKALNPSGPSTRSSGNEISRPPRYRITMQLAGETRMPWHAAMAMP